MENDLILQNDNEGSDGMLPTTSCSLPSSSGISLVVAFADPPYENESKQHYGWHKDFQGEVDYTVLTERLCKEYANWIMCMKVSTLPKIAMKLDADGVKYRIGVWCKTNSVFKKNVNPVYSWEPVIFVGGRRLPKDHGWVRDYCLSPIAVRRDRFVGAKPQAFCNWIFAMMGMQCGDSMEDIFPGTGAVGNAWEFVNANGDLFNQS